MARFFAITKRAVKANTPEPLVEGDLLVTSVLLQACGGNSKDRGRNSGKIYIGDRSMGEEGDNCLQIAAPPPGVTPDVIPLDRADGTVTLNLATIWIKADKAGDGVTALCEER